MHGETVKFWGIFNFDGNKTSFKSADPTERLNMI
jgi:hypothetical protein